MSELHVGFTGTRGGLSENQREALPQLLRNLMGQAPGNVTCVLHHGDCLGADEAAHHIAGECGWKVVLHPGEDGEGNSPHRAYCSDFDDHVLDVHDSKPYAERNVDIVASTVMLVACPKGKEIRRSGTWSTVRLAQRLGRVVYVLPPVDPQQP